MSQATFVLVLGGLLLLSVKLHSDSKFKDHDRRTTEYVDDVSDAHVSQAGNILWGRYQNVFNPKKFLTDSTFSNRSRLTQLMNHHDPHVRAKAMEKAIKLNYHYGDNWPRPVYQDHGLAPIKTQ